MIPVILDRIADRVSRRPWRVLALAVLLSVAGGLGALLKLEFRPGRQQLIDPDQSYFRRYENYSQSYVGEALLLVVIHVDGVPQRAAEAAGWIQTHLEQRVGQELDAVHARRETEFLQTYGGLLAPEPELLRMEQMLRSNGPMLSRWAGYPDLPAMLEDLAMQLGDATPSVGEVETERGIAFLQSLLLSSGRIIAGQSYEPLLAELGPPASGPLAPFFVSTSGQLVFLYLQPRISTSELNSGARAVLATRDVLSAARKKFQGLRVGLTGRPALDADEMFSTQRDMKLAFLLALVGVTLLFVFVFRSVRRPLMAVLAMLLAVAWTFGLAAVYPGYLNLLSIVFALILIGLGIDFGIYFLSAYEEARSVAPEVPVAIRATLARVGKPILYGAITTVIAFYTAMFVDFRGVAELGLLAGTGVLFCLLSMFIVLPSLLLVGDQEGPSPAQEPRSLRVRYPVRVLWILLLAAGLTIGMVPGLLKLRFSYNPRKLQAKGLQSVTYEKVVQEQSGQSTWFGVVTAPTREALRKKVDALARLKQVKQVRSVLDVWPLTTSARRERLAQLARLFPPVGPRSKAPPAVGRCVGLYRKLSGLFEQAGDDLFLSRPQQAERLLGLAQASTGLAEQLADLPPRTASQRLEELQAALFAEMDGTIARVRRLLGSREIRQQDLPEFYRRLFVARDHPEFAAHVYPAFDIAQGDRMEDYMEACLGVDSGFTGPPMLFYRTSRLMRYGFERASLYALVAVLLVLVVTLRDPLSVALALTPLGLGLTWTGGLMGYLGMPLDLANCFGVPILLGIGVDVGIHLVHAFRATGAVDKIWSTTGRAVVVTTLTTMIGFGSMLIAHHRGLAGLGTLVTLGMCATLLASLGVLPAVFRLIEQSPPDETTDATPEPLAPDPERLDPAAEPPGRATD